MAQSVNDFPHLAAFVSGWFHQDFDLEGETIQDVVKAYSRNSSSAERQELLDNIANFLQIEEEHLHSEFTRIFNPDIDPDGLSGSTKTFLEEIRSVLSQIKD
jgi:hypothetical protein